MADDETLDDVSEKEILIEIFKQTRAIRRLLYAYMWITVGLVTLSVITGVALELRRR